MKTLLAALIALLLCVAMSAGDTRIRAGDEVRLICDQAPSFNGSFRVAKDGTVGLPLLGRLVLDDLTEDQAAKLISSLILRNGFARAATVSVRLIESPDSPVTYGGAVKKGGEMPYRAALRLRDLVAVAEPTEAADLGKVTVTSRNGAVATIDLLTNLNPELRPGDRIFFPLLTVPKEVYVLGAVIQPGQVPFVPGLTAQDALAKAGGPTRHANVQRAKVVKPNGEEWPLDLEAGAKPLLVEPGDTIAIPVADEPRFVSIVGAVRNPGAVPYTKGLLLKDAVESAGGFLPNADVGRIKIRRPVRSGPDVFGVLQAFDLVEVPFLPGTGRGGSEGSR